MAKASKLGPISTDWYIYFKWENNDHADINTMQTTLNLQAKCVKSGDVPT